MEPHKVHHEAVCGPSSRLWASGGQRAELEIRNV